MQDEHGTYWISCPAQFDGKEDTFVLPSEGPFFHCAGAEYAFSACCPRPNVLWPFPDRERCGPVCGAGIGYFRSHRALQLVRRNVAVTFCEQGIACALKAVSIKRLRSIRQRFGSTRSSL